MFGRKQRRHSVVDSLVGSNTQVNGDLIFTGGCHIDGTVKGNVSAEADNHSALSISEDGTVEGGVNGTLCRAERHRPGRRRCYPAGGTRAHRAGHW